MKRRDVLAGSAAGAVAASSFPKPALSQGVMRWRMVTAWPKNLPGPGVAAQMLADRCTPAEGPKRRRASDIRLIFD